MINLADKQFYGRVGLNYLPNPSGVNGTVGWSTFTTTFVNNVPTTITGGGPAFTIVPQNSMRAPTLSTSISAAATSGQGIISDVMVLDLADRAKVFSFQCDYKLFPSSAVNVSGTSSQTIEVWVYDVINAVWIQPAGYRGMNQSGVQCGFLNSTFQTSASGYAYRVAFIVKNPPSGTLLFEWAQGTFGPQNTVQGAPVTDWTSYTPAMTGGTASTISGRWSRIGDSVHVRAYAILSAGGVYSISLPFPVDATKFPNNTSNAYYGMASYSDISANISYVGMPYFPTSTTVRIYGPNTTEWSATTPVAFGAGDVITIDVFYPVQGWAANVQMSQDTDTRVVACYRRSDTATTVTATTSNTVITTLATSILDTHSAWDATNNRYVVPVSGAYRITGSIYYPSVSVANQVGFCVILIDGANAGDVASEYNNETLNGLSMTVTGSLVKFLNAGQTIQLAARTGSGTTTAGSFNPSYLSIERLSGPSVIAASETVGCLYNTLAAGTVTAAGIDLIYLTKEFDTHGSYSTSTGEYTVPVSGKYTINGSYRTQTTAMTITHGTTLYVRVDGVLVKFIQNLRTQTTTGILREIMGIPVTLNLNAGQKIKFGASSDTNAAIDTASLPTAFNWVSIMRTGN